MDAVTRTNSDWLADLRSEGSARDAAIADLRAWLQRSALFYLRRQTRERNRLDADEIGAMAEDAAQDATLAVIAKLDSFRGEARFLTWASKFGIACAIGLLRKRRWRDVPLDTLPSGWDSAPEVAVSRDGWGHPELAAQRNEIWAVLRDVARDDLTDKQRQAFSFMIVHGVEIDVVASHLGTTPGALYKLTHDARRKFKKALERRGLTADEILRAFANPG